MQGEEAFAAFAKEIRQQVMRKKAASSNIIVNYFVILSIQEEIW